jgi:hypothetical protein
MPPAEPSLSDETLVRLCLEKQPAAWAELVSRYRERVRNAARRLLGGTAADTAGYVLTTRDRAVSPPTSWP